MDKGQYITYFVDIMTVDVKNNKENSGFPERLRSLRIQKGLSQSDLAKLINVHNNNISRYERGESKPSAESLRILADALEVSTDYLYDGDEEDAAVADFGDKDLLYMFREIEKFSDENKKHIKALINAFIKAEKHKQIAS